MFRSFSNHQPQKHESTLSSCGSPIHPSNIVPKIHLFLLDRLPIDLLGKIIHQLECTDIVALMHTSKHVAFRMSHLPISLDCPQFDHINDYMLDTILQLNHILKYQGRITNERLIIHLQHCHSLTHLELRDTRSKAFNYKLLVTPHYFDALKLLTHLSLYLVWSHTDKIWLNTLPNALTHLTLIGDGLDAPNVFDETVTLPPHLKHLEIHGTCMPSQLILPDSVIDFIYSGTMEEPVTLIVSPHLQSLNVHIMLPTWGLYPLYIPTLPASLKHLTLSDVELSNQSFSTHHLHQLTSLHLEYTDKIPDLWNNYFESNIFDQHLVSLSLKLTDPCAVIEKQWHCPRRVQKLTLQKVYLYTLPFTLESIHCKDFELDTTVHQWIQKHPTQLKRLKIDAFVTDDLFNTIAKMTQLTYLHLCDFQPEKMMAFVPNMPKSITTLSLYQHFGFRNGFALTSYEWLDDYAHVQCLKLRSIRIHTATHLPQHIAHVKAMIDLPIHHWNGDEDLIPPHLFFTLPFRERKRIHSGAAFRQMAQQYQQYQQHEDE